MNPMISSLMADQHRRELMRQADEARLAGEGRRGRAIARSAHGTASLLRSVADRLDSLAAAHAPR
jgi:hypothetical protein